MDMVSDIKRIVDELVGAYKKRITVLEEAADDFCDLLENEWIKRGHRDSVTEKDKEKYEKACLRIGRNPYLIVCRHTGTGKEEMYEEGD
jgi:hypothetical protein